jgi:hypothetical protein
MLRLIAGSASLLVALALAASGPAGVGDDGREPGSSFKLDHARAFDEFPLYNAGNRVDGLPLVAVMRRDDTARYVSFVYGDCAPGDEGGCAPPAEIQVWPACRRNLALYTGSRPDTPAAEQTTIRGVPAVSLDDGTRLELQTGGSTVVVFSDSRARALGVAGALRAVDGSIPAGTPLPEPAPGAVDGALAC